MARQRQLNQALMGIPRRAESTDRYTLATTYVAAGSFAALLNSSDHQILFGRRGTGKTHALLYLRDLLEQMGHLPIYVDLRTIGSAGGLYADHSLSRTMRGTHLLVDTLEAIHDELLTVAVEREVSNQDALLRALDALAEAASAIEVVGEVEREIRVGGSTESARAVGLTASSTPAATLSATHRRSVTAESRLRRTGVERHHVMFGPLSRALRAEVGSLGGAQLWLLLDEWSSIPLDLQPLLADLLRRGMLPVPGITVKLAAIERRSRFAEAKKDGDYLGIEIGSDAASAVSLDDFLIFDHGRSRAQRFFGKLFFNHASARLSAMVRDPPADADAFLEESFRRNAFAELVRAAEGVPRDAINIAALAAQHAHDEPIGLAEVRRAARDWYLRDKQTVISTNEAASRTLRFLIDEVVGRRRSRTFLLQHLGRRDAVEELCDARLLHVLRRGIVDRHHPGTLYDGFAIDYGCYVALLMDADSHFRPRDRIEWLNSPKGIPPDGFNFAQLTIDLSTV